MYNVKVVTVIGANGVMGSNVAGIFAAFGNAKVYMVSRTTQKSEIAKLKVIESVKSDSILNHIISKDYSELQNCIQESDIVFESISENLDLKKDILKQIGKYVNKNTIICTGTSGLSITDMASVLPDEIKKNYLGLHFYNPPYKMTLCELVASEYTDKILMDYIENYATNILYRTVVRVKDKPAFLGNRIGFQFINQAMQCAEKYKSNGGIDYIDNILGPFTGRNMPPLITADFVGLDIYKAIVDNLYNNTESFIKDTFLMPKYVEKLIEKGYNGKKVNIGLYQKKELKKYVYDIETDCFREKKEYEFPFVEKMLFFLESGDYKTAFQILINHNSLEAQLCLEFLLKYILYSLYASKSVSGCISAADDVMAAGFNWCPPFALIEALFGKENVSGLLRERIDKELLLNVDMEYLMKDVVESKYDFRKFIRARK